MDSKNPKRACNFCYELWQPCHEDPEDVESFAGVEKIEKNQRVDKVVEVEEEEEEDGLLSVDLEAISGPPQAPPRSQIGLVATGSRLVVVRNELFDHLRPTRRYSPTREVTVSRENAFLDSYEALKALSAEDFKNDQFDISFIGNEGIDAGGLTREWYTLVSQQMLHSDNGLFKVAADRTSYQPDPEATALLQLEKLKFCGRFFGKALYSKNLVDCRFTRLFYKKILNKEIFEEDVKLAEGPSFAKIIDDIRQARRLPADTYYFSDKDEPVTNRNKEEYILSELINPKMHAIDTQVEAFRTGFNEIVPAEFLKDVTPSMLELLTRGLPDIDIDDLERNTTCLLSAERAQWFWAAVRSFDKEQKARLLYFATGSSQVPSGGFANLLGNGGRVEKFRLSDASYLEVNSLPRAHTCFNTIDVPRYPSYKVLHDKLLFAIEESEGFSGVD